MLKTLIFISLFFMSCLTLGQTSFEPKRVTNGHTFTEASTGAFKDVTNDGLVDFVFLKEEEFFNSSPKKYIAYYEATASGAYITAQKLQDIPYLGLSIEEFYFLDMDNDGDDDLVLTSDLSGIIMYPNIGGGNFGSETILRPPSMGMLNFSMHPKFFDYDLDGDLDAFINSDSQEFRLLINVNMNFIDSTVLFDGDNVYNAHIADLDNNGKLDIIAEKSASSFVYAHLNDASNGMSPNSITLPINLGNTQSVLALSDLNNDGNIDVVVSDLLDIGVYFNNGATYTYQNLFTTPNGGTTNNLQIEDVNNDGLVDIVGGINNMNILIVATQDVNGDFTVSQQLQDDLIQANGEFVFKDLDNDGFNEFYNYSSANGSALQVSVYDNAQGTYEFQENELCLGFDNFDYGDLNNDGEIDIVKISSKTNSYQMLLNNGNDTYTIEDRKLSMGNHQLNGIRVGKYNTDNNLDLFVYEEILDDQMYSYVLEGQGNLQFVAPVNLTSGKRFTLFGDFDKDGLMDFYCPVMLDTIIGGLNLGGSYLQDTLVHSNGSANPAYNIQPKLINDKLAYSSFEEVDVPGVLNGHFYLNENDDFAFVALNTFYVLSSTNSDLNASVAYDFDNDGVVELMFSDSQIGQSSINLKDLDFNIQINLDNSSLISNVSGSDYAAKEMELIDFNLDGLMDVLFINKDASPSLYLLENLGGGNFAAPALIDTRNNLQNLRVCDMNHDFFDDILAFSSGFESITHYRNGEVNEETASGWIYHDVNMNGVKDQNEDGLNIDGLQINPLPALSIYNGDGSYKLIFDNTPQNYTLQFSHPLWQLTTPTSYTLNVNPSFTTTNDLNFGIVPSATATDSVSVTTTTIGNVCDGVNSLNITATNEGNTIGSGFLAVEVDPALTGANVVPTPDSITGNIYYFSYSNLGYTANYDIAFNFNNPGFMAAGDTLEHVVSSQVYTATGPSAMLTDSVMEILTCPFDPNEKTALPLGFGPMNYISEEDSVIQYTINFQNTGTDTAVNVVLKDQLSPLFDYSSFQLISSKHPVDYSLTQSGLLIFNFNNINLPDSNASYLNSQGFVSFRIELNNQAQPGSVIVNQAGIYFDNNPVVQTNTVERVIYSCSNANLNIDFDNYQDSLCGDFSGLLNLPNAHPQNGVFVGPGVTGNQYHYDSLQEGMNSFEYIVEGELNCLYTKTFTIYKGSCLGVDGYDELIDWKVQPNPFNNAATIELNIDDQSDYTVELYNLTGQFIAQYTFNQSGQVELERSNLQSGMYIVKLLKKGRIIASKKIIVIE